MTVDLRVLEGRQTWREAWRRLSLWERFKIRRGIGSFEVFDDPNDAALAVGFIRRMRMAGVGRDQTMTYVAKLGWMRGQHATESIEECERLNLDVVRRASTPNAP